MPALFLDENVKVELADALSAAGIETHTTVGEQRLQAIDADQLLFYANQGRVCVTQNRRDFLTLHEGWAAWTGAWGIPLAHSGILILDQGPLIPILMAALVPFLAGLPRSRIGCGTGTTTRRSGRNSPSAAHANAARHRKGSEATSHRWIIAYRFSFFGNCGSCPQTSACPCGRPQR